MGTNKRSWRGKVQRKERKKTAVELQAGGMSERRIAEVLGESKSTVHRLLAEANDEALADPELVKMRRDRIRAVIDGQLERWVPRSSKGNTAAALVVTRLLDRLAKLDGADAPTRTELSGPHAGPIELVDAAESVARKLAQLLAAEGGDPSKPDN